jgi:hypothetical protein
MYGTVCVSCTNSPKLTYEIKDMPLLENISVIIVVVGCMCIVTVERGCRRWWLNVNEWRIHLPLGSVNATWEEVGRAQG